MEIQFINSMEVSDLYRPKPASQFIPDWYKNMNSYITDDKKVPNGEGLTSGTIKRCMPVFDVITSGYIITTYVDLYVSQKEEILQDGTVKIVPHFQWPMFEPIEFHDPSQGPTHPASNGFPFPKWKNPWSIKTPPGYSTLFMPPVHRSNPFTVLSGVVDTDTYTLPVNFPCVLTDIKFEGLVPAGTPLAQVIPFKRDSWNMVVTDDQVEHNKNIGVQKTLRSKIFDSYKSQFRQDKSYK
jgi:hypothetical protein